MKQSDLQQAPRILAMIQALTDTECSSVEISNDNPDFATGNPDCLISVSGMEPEDFEEFRADTLAECLELALEAKGKKVPIGAAVDWAGRYARLHAAVAELLTHLLPGTEGNAHVPAELIKRTSAAMEASRSWETGVRFGRS